MTCRVRPKGLDMLLLPLAKGRMAPYLKNPSVLIRLKKGNRQNGKSVGSMGPANCVWRDQLIDMFSS